MAKTLTIVVSADVDNSMSQIEADIDKIQSKINKKLEVVAHIKDITIDESALKSVRGQIQKIFSHVTVDIDGNILNVGAGKAECLTSIEKYARTLETRLQNIFNPRLFSDGSQIKKRFDELAAAIKNAKTKSELDKLTENIFEFKNAIDGIYKPLSSFQSRLDSFSSRKMLLLNEGQINELNKLKKEVSAAWNNPDTDIKTINTLEARITSLISSMQRGNPTAENFAARMDKIFASFNRINSVAGTHKGLNWGDEIKGIADALGALNASINPAGVFNEKNWNDLFSNFEKFGTIDVNELRGYFQHLTPENFSPEQWEHISQSVTGLVSNLESAEARIKQVSSQMRRDNGMETYRKRIEMLSNELNTFYTKYGKISQSQDFAMDYSNLVKRIEAASKNPNDSELTNLTKDIKNFEKAAKDAGLTTDTFGEKVQKAYQKFGGWAIVTTTMMKVVQYIKMMYQNVVLLDTAMTELKKVTDETQAGYEAFMNRAKDTAKEIGSALSDVIRATADFSRVGYSISEAEELSKAALVYKQVGDGIEDVTTASETLISTMKAFSGQYGESGDAMLIIDKLNEVGNTQAITSAGLGEALSRSASAMAEAGNTLDETIALATAMNTTLQNPERVGTTLKTMSMFLRAAKVDAEEAGVATDGMAASVSKLRDKILALTKNTDSPVDIMLNPTTFKSSYQIIQELSKVWEQIEAVDRSAIMELIGGKRNANAMASLLQNFNVAEKTLVTSLNAAGSATKENEKYLESIRGKLTLLQSSFESLSSSVMNSEVVKFGIEGITDFVDALDWLTQTVSPIPGLITAVGVALNALNFKAFDLNYNANGDIQNSGLFHLFDNKLFGKQAKEAKDAINNIVTESYEVSDSMEAVNITVQNTGDSLEDMAESMVTAGNGATALRLKQLALNAAFNLGIAAASALLIYLGKQLYDAAVVTGAEMQKCADAAENMARSLNENNDYIGQIEEMSAILKNSITSQYELNNAKESLLKIQDSLLEKYGSEFKSIDLVNGGYEEAIHLLKEKARWEYNAWRNTNEDAISKANTRYYEDWTSQGWWEKVGDDLKALIGGTSLSEAKFRVTSDSASIKQIKDLSSQSSELTRAYDSIFEKTADGYLQLKGNADEAAHALNVFITAIKEGGKEKEYANLLASLVALYDKAADSAQYANVAISNVEGAAKNDSRFSGYYDELIGKISTLQNALKTTDSQAISDAYAQAVMAMDKAVSVASNSSSQYGEQIADYFRNLYPNLQKEFEQFQFDIRLNADDGDLRKQFTGIVQKLNNMGLDETVKIKAAVESKGLTEPFQELQSIAQEYGYTVDELIDKLGQFGYVQSSSLSDSLFSDSTSEIQAITSSYENSISVLQKLRKEQDSLGKVSSASYAELIALGDDYKNIVTSQVDATGELIYIYDSDAADKFAQEQANLAIQSLYAANATEAEMEAFRKMYQSVSTVSTQLQKYAASAKSIVSLQKDIAEGTEYTYAEVLKLSETYPELVYTYDELSGRYKIEQSSVAGLTARYDELIKKIIELRNELSKEFAFDAIRAGGYQNASESQVRALYKMVETQIKQHNITSVEEYRKLTTSELKPWVVATIESILSAQTDTMQYLSDNIQWATESKTSSDSSKDVWKEQFEKWYSEKNHALEMGRISEESYVAELEAMYQKYFSNLGKYQDEYFKYEKEVYQKRQQLVNEYITKVEEQVKKSGDETKMVEALNDLLREKNAILSKEQKKTIDEKIVSYTVKGYQDSIDLLEDQIDLISDRNNSEEEVISIYKEILGYLDTIRGYYQSLGYEESSDQLLELSRKYQDYVNKIESINEKIYEEQKKAQIKLLKEENDAIDSAVDAMDDILDATVDLIKRELNAQIDALDDEKDAVKAHYDELKESTNEYYSGLTDRAKESYNSQKEEMNAYYDNLIDSIKESSDAQKKALKEELDAYKKIIDAQKEKLQGIRDEENYNANVADKNKSIASLQSQIDALSLDDSRAAQAKRLKLEEELVKAKKDLADYQADYSLDKQLETLDKEYDAFEENINKQIDAIENSADEETKIYQKKQKEMLKLLESQHNAELKSIDERKQAALNRIEAERESALASLDAQISALRNHLSKEGVLWQEANERIRTQGASLWQELRAYAAEYTRDVEKLEDAWNQALSAVDKYNDGSMDFTQAKSNATSKRTQNESEINRLESETYAGSKADETRLIESTRELMKENSRMWHKVESQYEKSLYAQLNQELAQDLNKRLGRQALTHNAAKGVWYLDGVRFYHKGGIVGSGTLKQNETLAVLQNGEAVLTKRSQETLARYMELAKTINSSMVSWRANDPVRVISKGLIRRSPVYEHDVEPIVVEKLFDFHADNVTSESLPQLEKLLKRASEYTMEQMEDRLARRGVKTKIKGNSI